MFVSFSTAFRVPESLGFFLEQQKQSPLWGSKIHFHCVHHRNSLYVFMKVAFKFYKTKTLARCGFKSRAVRSRSQSDCRKR